MIPNHFTVVSLIHHGVKARVLKWALSFRQPHVELMKVIQRTLNCQESFCGTVSTFLSEFYKNQSFPKFFNFFFLFYFLLINKVQSGLRIIAAILMDLLLFYYSALCCKVSVWDYKPVYLYWTAVDCFFFFFFFCTFSFSNT